MHRALRLSLSVLVICPSIGLCQDAGPKRPDEVVCPRVDSTPQLDGVLDDECWTGAAVIQDFTPPLSAEPANKPMRALLCFDDEALYVGVVCSEPHPERIKTGAADGSNSVWQDDCVEIFLRTTGSSLEFDQFILNAAGARQSVRVRLAGREQWEPSWRGAANIGDDTWTAEMAIPFLDLGIETPQPGFMAQLKIGREDNAGEGTKLSTWPPRSPYGKAAEGYGKLYFGSANLLPNPDMSLQEDGAVIAWGFHEDDAPLFSSVEDRGQQVIRWETPGRYSVAQQSLRLKPNGFYRLEALLRGTAGVYLRARTYERKGSESRPFSVYTRPSEEYVHYQVAFPTGEEGTALIIIGNTEALGKGEVFIADLTVAQEIGYEDAGPAIPIAAGQTLYLTDIAIADCKSLRGFVVGPVDGRLDSYRWDGGVWEYGMPNAGAGVYYDFSNGDGLHIKLADNGGVDAVQIRNGARVKLYRNCTSYYEPGKGVLIWDFTTGAKNSRALFDKRVMSDSLSFFQLKDGHIADLSFLRIGDSLQLPEPQVFTATGQETPADLKPDAEKRFAENDRTFFKLEAGEARRLEAQKGQFLHFVTPPLVGEIGLLAVGVRLNLPEAPVGMPISLRVQDPFNPRMELMGADLTAEGPGELYVIMNHQDQIVPAGQRIWVSVRFGAATTVDAAQVELYACPREQALPEALAYRKLILKGVFCASSEARPWTGMRNQEDLDRIEKTHMIGRQVGELLRCVEFCKQLGPDDDTVREYYEWLWRRAGLEPYEPRIDEVPGAPEWAVVLRQAWLEAREVPGWWLENRVVPTGEFGGRVNDDSCMYQNYADFPMISDDGVALGIKRGAAALAEHTETHTLEHGLNRRTMDPLHAYEEGVNHESLMMWWNYGDPVYFERCMLAAKSLPALTVMTPKGHRHFKSQRCGAEDLRIDRPTDTDGHAHPLMLHPAFEVAWYNHHPQVIQFLREWADGWLEHQQPGDYATTVEVATEKVVQSHKTRPLYGGYGGQASAFMLMYYVTGDGKYLRPFTDYYAKGEAPYPSERQLYELYQAGALDDYSEHFQRLAERSDMMKCMVTGDKTPLIEALKGDIAEMQRFRHMYTTAHQFTDRIFLSAITRATKCYCGGYATRNKYNHHHACSWEGLGTDFAALVLRARPDHFKAIVYNLAEEALEGSLRLWTLQYCDYRITMGPDADGDDEADATTKDFRKLLKRGEAVPVTLPSKQLTVIELTQHQNPEPVLREPDLALSPLDTVVENGTVRGFVHNIGTAPKFAVVCLTNPAGDVVQKKELGEVAWPEDLEPVRVPYEFTEVPDDLTGWRVFVTGTEAVVEICEGNNELALGKDGPH